MNDVIAPKDSGAPAQANASSDNGLNALDIMLQSTAGASGPALKLANIDASHFSSAPGVSGLENTLPTVTFDNSMPVEAKPVPAAAVGQTEAPPAQDWFHDALSIAWDIGVGAVNQVTQHPLETLEVAGVGAALGIAGTLCAPIAIGAGVIGGGYLAYQAITHGGELINDANVIANQENYTQAEVDKAHEGMQDFGGGVALAAAGMAGGMVGSYATGAVVAAVESNAAAVQAAQAADEAWSAEVNAKLSSILGGKTAPVEVVPPPPPYVGITAETTTLSLADQAGWAKVMDANPEGMGNAILTFANRWATMMEQHMAAGEPLTGSSALNLSNAADTEGITGSMFGAARNLLIRVWKFGPDLAKALDQ